MDVAWIILDALSFEATPFADNGPETMPEISEISENHGVVFTEAYAPGTSSPSSHASMFTGELPSRTGMHEASPYFDNDLPTIGEQMAQSHRSFLVSYNPFIFNGLDRGFDQTNDLRGSQYMIFDDATDPRRFLVENRDTPVPRRYLDFLRESNRPLKSLINGLGFKLWDWRTENGRPEEVAAATATHQYAAEMNEHIREFLSSSSEDSFVVANYMDIHPPLGASNAALEKFAPRKSRSELPIGKRSPDIIKNIQEGDRTIEAEMESLYYAAIWDTDRIVGPLIRDLVDDGAHVIVTADHGSRFTGCSSLSDRRIHVPLVVFAPDTEPRTVNASVNIRSMAATTMKQVRPGTDVFTGDDLLSAEDDRVSITEFIHDASPTGNDVSAFGDYESVAYDITAIKGDSRLDWIDETYTNSGDDSDIEELREVVDELAETGLDKSSGGEVSYDQDTEERLQDLGYL